MQIKKNSVVTMDYHLRDDENTIIDSSGDSGPFPYLHGAGGVIPGLESAMEGKKVGDKIKVRIPPEEGYGERDESLLQSVPRENFQGIDDISVGMQFQTPMEDGSQQVVTVMT
ncbi:MAG: peptidylprolyl isomerase, partial [Gammaproteobacteria bacterium]|nr:peptidylprolyl isomerase [Gammaproteobacteria bacterium]